MRPYKLPDGSTIDLDKVVRIGPLQYDPNYHYIHDQHITGVHHRVTSVLDVSGIPNPLVIVFCELDDRSKRWHEDSDKHRKSVIDLGNKGYDEFMDAVTSKHE